MLPEQLRFTLEAIECPIKRQLFIDEWHKLTENGQAKVLEIISLKVCEDRVEELRRSQLGLD